MTRFTTTLVALAALLCALALVPVTAASAGTPGSPRTWHVLVGGQSEDQAVQAEGYYPHVITIDAGDTVTWTLNSPELHGVVFTGTCEDASCISPDCLTIVREGLNDISPCGPSSYDGVTALDQSAKGSTISARAGRPATTVSPPWTSPAGWFPRYTTGTTPSPTGPRRTR